ncbi:MAG: choice-of-anchor D domain-containing protein [Xanthomonadales bacterium]|nr:hypothetical protein [Xanthomonadales bacterium]MCC6591691.1 choice-of-anchor D domain-containing protein [Xanthomonadales bacterium]MCE7931276.1 choice-of-anchor D domain-containing protein [Xanthomonadales bacterium PRO6]
MLTRLLAFVAVFASWSGAALAYDERWPDYDVVATDRGNSGTASYFQGFESPCFGPPYQPGTNEPDWVRYYSEVSRVATGTSGIASRNGLFHAEVLPPLPGAPGANTGAYTRLGGYRLGFGGGFTVEMDVYFDLNDPRVLSGINADYGWDATAAVNTQAGVHRRDFIFFTASNTSGQILVGSGNISNFAPQTNLAGGPHYVVAASGWYTLQWVFRDNGSGILAVDTNLRSGAGALLWTRTLSNAADVIATQIGGNRYLWFPYVRSQRVPIENVRLNSGVREALYASTPGSGVGLNAGTANIGNPAPGAILSVQNQGTLRLDICGCSIAGPDAADFSVQTCPNSVEPANVLALSVGCTPSAAGARNASLTVRTNDSTRGTDFTYPLQCNGVDPNALPAVAVPVDSRWMLALLTLLLAGLALSWLMRRD